MLILSFKSKRHFPSKCIQKAALCFFLEVKLQWHRNRATAFNGSKIWENRGQGYFTTDLAQSEVITPIPLHCVIHLLSSRCSPVGGYSVFQHGPSRPMRHSRSWSLQTIVLFGSRNHCLDDVHLRREKQKRFLSVPLKCNDINISLFPNSFATVDV